VALVTGEAAAMHRPCIGHASGVSGYILVALQRSTELSAAELSAACWMTDQPSTTEFQTHRVRQSDQHDP
jgi:hypothetical protein